MRKLYRDLAIIIVIFLIYKSFVLILDQNDRVVMLSFGKPLKEITDPGLHWRWPFPFNSVKYLPKRSFLYDSDRRDLITKDKQTLLGDAFALVRIKDGIKFIQKAGGSIDAAMPKIDDKIYSTVHNVIGMYNFHEIIVDERMAIMDSMTAISNNLLDDLGLSTDFVRLKLVNLPPENALSVYKRMISERKQKAGEYRSMGRSDSIAICSQTDAEVKSILAAAVQDSMDIVGTS